jgi:hypothetical protein
MWDSEFLYIRFECEDDSIFLSKIGRDEKIYESDAVEIFLDPVGDQRQYFELQHNAAGAVLDILWVASGEPERGPNRLYSDRTRNRELWDSWSWNMTGLRTAANRVTFANGKTGWISELALPAAAVLRRLGWRAYGPMKLRANFVRIDYPAAPASHPAMESSAWSRVMHGRPHISPYAMGVLELIEQK